jgi:UDP-3-O-[3-hydroxymyristoyl] N-acetylglucosamine deacetylase
LGIGLAFSADEQGAFMSFQRTLKSPVSLSGLGLHSGKTVNLTLRPARPNTGIVFVRTDLSGAPRIPAHFTNVKNTQFATTIGNGEASISTVEHVMAALHGMCIDNAIVEIDAPEAPILDGSALGFCGAIQEAGISSQLRRRSYLSLRRKIEIKVAEKWAVAEPSCCLEIHGSIEWDHPSIGYQEYHYAEGTTPFAEIAAARTFGFLSEVEKLKSMGLARGGSLDNAVVLDHALVLNPDGLRFPDEFIRHKILDALGDFKLAGIPIHAHVRLHRAGHDLHAQLLAAIFENPDNYEIVTDSAREVRRPARVRAVALARGLAASV